VRLEGARVTVLGLARTGAAAARALIERGAEVTVLDAADGPGQRSRAAELAARTILGRSVAADVAGADLVVASPGVPWASGWIAAALSDGIPVWSEIELAYRLGVEPVAAITGTNGKTTTVEMVAACLRAAGTDAVAAGNIGSPLIDAPPGAAVVAEVSSFQLQAIHRFHAPVACLLNVASDHLDWHGSLEAYGAAKRKLFENQRAGDVAVVLDDPACLRLVDGPGTMRRFGAGEPPPGGAGVREGWIVVPEGRVCEVASLRGAGHAFLADAVAAAAVACATGAPPEAAGEGLAGYVPGPHKQEFVAEIDGVAYVNDSKATDPHATLAALRGRADVVLIAGGRNKGVDLGELREGVPSLRHVVAFGEAAPEVRDAFASTAVGVTVTASLDDAVEAAADRAVRGGTVLLSPACASWDAFTGYEARGEAFRSAVKRLEGRMR